MTSRVRVLHLERTERRVLSITLLVLSVLVSGFVAIRMRQATIIEFLAKQNITEAIDAMLNDSDYPYVLMNDQGVITEWNPAMERLTGYDRSEIIGIPGAVEKIIPPNMQSRHYAAYTAALANQSLVNKTTRVSHCELVCKDGTRKPIQITVRVVQTRHDGKIAAAHFDEPGSVREVGDRE